MRQLIEDRTKIGNTKLLLDLLNQDTPLEMYRVIFKGIPKANAHKNKQKRYINAVQKTSVQFAFLVNVQSAWSQTCVDVHIQYIVCVCACLLQILCIFFVIVIIQMFIDKCLLKNANRGVRFKTNSLV